MNLYSAFALFQTFLTRRNPAYVQFAVTGKCCLDCITCNSNKSRIIEKDLSLKEVEIISALLKKMKVLNIVLTGGEIFLRDDIVGIANLFKKQGISVRFQTNGILFNEKKIDAMIDNGFYDFTISLDSFDSETQDRLSGK